MNDELIKSCKAAEITKYSAGDTIFRVGELPLYYHQISQGSVKLLSKSSGAKELIQEIRQQDQSIAEFTLFVDDSYPMTAVAITDCIIIKLPIADFLLLMIKHPEINMHVLRNMSVSLHYKFLMADVYFKQNTADKVMVLLDYLKRKHSDHTPYSFPVLLTRQEIANLTGMRVETVIRTIKKMEKQQILKIIDRKIFY